MELVDKYLDETTLIADFWIADNSNEIKSIVNQGMTIEKSKIYLNQYFINVIMERDHFLEIQTEAKDWQKKFPKAIITKANGKVIAYDLRFKKETLRGDNYMVLEFAGQPQKD